MTTAGATFERESPKRRKRGSILPFPIAARKGMVHRLALHRAYDSPMSARHWIDRETGKFRDAMLRLGVEVEHIDREIAALTNAVDREAIAMARTGGVA